jgi:hypothetical protein
VGFDAAVAVSELDYDFTKFVPGCVGVTPEPTTEQVRTMQRKLRALFKLDDKDPLALTKHLAKMSEAEYKDHDEELAHIYADACSQMPSTAEILGLPHRLQVAFIGYISGEFGTPTAGSSGITR